MFSTRIETERLHLERISHDSVDVFALHEFYSDRDATKEMFEYWGSSPHETVKETYDYLDGAEQLWDEAAQSLRTFYLLLEFCFSIGVSSNYYSSA